MFRLLSISLFVVFGLTLASCSNFQQAKDPCVSDKALYKAADKRMIDSELFQHALACSNPQRVNTALISLGRIGGQKASALIQPLLKSENAMVRAAAAFSLGISGYSENVKALHLALKTEQTPEVQREITLAIGNLASPDSWAILNQALSTSSSEQAISGALQGLAILSVFNPSQIKDKSLLNVTQVFEHLKSPQTALEASFLLARTNLLNSSNASELLKLYPQLGDSSKAFVLRAMAKVNLKAFNDLYLKESESLHLGTRLTSLSGLGKYLNQYPKGFEVLQKQSYGDNVAAQIAAIKQLKLYMYPLRLRSHLLNDSSWVKSEAFVNFVNRGADLKDMQALANQWLDSKQANLERAAIAYFIKSKDTAKLQDLSKHSSSIIANGAKQALKIKEESSQKPLPTPKILESLPQSLMLKTTRGDIRIKLFADTPYTSTNFVRLAKEGFYDNSYFHRVIPNFVAQGGSKNGDGSGTVDYMIREELSMRSHRTGTIGMATAGKDTGGGQFFINLAPNLHLDSNYTIFGKVIAGMDVAMALEQNDQILSIQFE